jgi:GNAT superfamily N-acetyltransferase
MNFLAWRGERVIGHAALLPEPARPSCEFLIFVDQDNRHIGVGSELTALAVGESGKAGFSSVWLTVDATNHVAIRLYRKFGFTFTETSEYEHIMLLRTTATGPP